MHGIYVYFVAVLTVYSGLAQCKPFCCGYYPIYNYYSPGTISVPAQCPATYNCFHYNPTEVRGCKQRGDCLPTEICCTDHCHGSPICKLPTNGPLAAICPGIKSCAEYLRTKTTEPTACKNDNDCLHLEKCCVNPCENVMTCQPYTQWRI